MDARKYWRGVDRPPSWVMAHPDNDVVVKAHAYGNDFLYVDEWNALERDRVALARAICDRHTGIGADGLILYRRTPDGAKMRLLNADGSHAEVSGNGVRGLAALLIDVFGFASADGTVRVDTDAGEKTLTLVGREGRRPCSAPRSGQPARLARQTLEIAGEPVGVVTLNVGNPQCVRLESPLSEDRLHRLGPALERHPVFPGGTNSKWPKSNRQSRPHSHLGARRRPDARVGNGGVCRRCRGRGIRWRRPRCSRRVPRRQSACRVARGRPLPDGLGGSRAPRGVDTVGWSEESAYLRPRGGGSSCRRPRSVVNVCAIRARLPSRPVIAAAIHGPGPHRIPRSARTSCDINDR